MNWTKKHLVPLSACTAAIEKAEQYSHPQEAWDAWENGAELLWTLERTNADRTKLILCACEIAEHVLHWFEEECPNDKRPREAIEAARRCAKDRSSASIGTTIDAINAADAAAKESLGSARACYVARAAAYAGRTTIRTDYIATETAIHAADAARGDGNNAYVAEQKAQAEIVRKYFPVSPFVGSKPGKKGYRQEPNDKEKGANH